MNFSSSNNNHNSTSTSTSTSTGNNNSNATIPVGQLPSFESLQSPEAQAESNGLLTNLVTNPSGSSGGGDSSHSNSDGQRAFAEGLFRNYLNLKRDWALNPPPENPLMVSESCLSKAALSTVMGGGMGVVVGIVFGAMGGSPTSGILMPGIPEPPRKAWRHEIVDSLRQTRYKSRTWAKNFAFISGVYTGVECVVEKMRGKHDVLNSVGAGCITGAGLAVSSGPQAMCLGCAGFAAFSLAIDLVMGGH